MWTLFTVHWTAPNNSRTTITMRPWCSIFTLVNWLEPECHFAEHQQKKKDVLIGLVAFFASFAISSSSSCNLSNVLFMLLETRFLLVSSSFCHQRIAIAIAMASPKLPVGFLKRNMMINKFRIRIGWNWVPTFWYVPCPPWLKVFSLQRQKWYWEPIGFEEFIYKDGEDQLTGFKRTFCLDS